MNQGEDGVIQARDGGHDGYRWVDRVEIPISSQVGTLGNHAILMEIEEK